MNWFEQQNNLIALIGGYCYKKIIALLLTAVFILSPLSYSRVYATNITRTDITTEEKQLLGAAAIAYIEDYVQNTYLYQENDLTEGTISQVFENAEKSSILSESLKTTQYTLCGETVSATTLCERIASFEAAANYYKHIRTSQNFQRYNFTFTPSVLDVQVNTTTAYVHVYTLITFQYQPDTETTELGDNYEIYFLKLDGNWYIADVVSEAHVAYGLRDIATKYENMVSAFDSYLAAKQERVAIETPTESLDMRTTTTAYDRGYNRTNATAYAYTYTTSTYNDVSSGNNRVFCNDNFKYHSSGNCQNFVSQCVWAGFGGCDSLSMTGSQKFPMNTRWYSDKNEDDYSASWSGTISFNNYIASSDCEIISTTKTVNEDFSGTSLSQLVGSVLHVNPNESGYRHAIIITGATGYEFSEVSFCGNSPMRKGVILADDVTIHPEQGMRLIIPTSIKNGRNCSGGSHVFSGNHCRCSLCGFNKLTVTSAMLRPIAAGITKNIVAVANSTCYRMAICIKYGETETWMEYTNTNRISQSWTFSNTGLYTITIVARDVDPEYADSITTTHIFKIRVY